MKIVVVYFFQTFYYVFWVCNTIQDRFFLSSYDKLQQFVTKFVPLMGIKTFLISPYNRTTSDTQQTLRQNSKLLIFYNTLT